MSEATIVIEGFAAEPKQAVSQSGKQMLSVSVAHTPRKFNKQSQQWEDVLDRDGNKITLWARATFFEEMAQVISGMVGKGTLVRIEGEPRLSTYTDQSGQFRASLDVQFPKLSLVPMKPRQEGSQGGFGGGSAQGQGEWAQPPVNGAQNGFGGGADFDSQPF